MSDCSPFTLLDYQREYLDQLVRSCGVPAALFRHSGQSTLTSSAVVHRAMFERAQAAHARRLVARLDDMLEPLFLAGVLALEEYRKSTLEAELARLAGRRWDNYLARRFRGRPGFRFADLMGVGRN